MASIVEGITVIFCVGWAAAFLLARSSAAMRHGVWTCAFVAAMLLAPLRLRMPQRSIAPQPAVATVTTVIVRTATEANAAADGSRILAVVWLLGTLAMTARLVRNSIALGSIVREASGRPPMLTSSRISGPMVAGIRRPVILLPRSSEGWTAERRKAVLAHEAAHIRRRDPAILLMTHLVTALYWFHPLVWFAAAKLRAEGECACDDAALRTGLPASAYAGHLLDLARRFHPQLAIPMATTCHLEPRVKHILDLKTNRSSPTRAAWFAAIAVTAAVLAPLTTWTLDAQQAGGASIAGTVIDASGARVPNAHVTAINAETASEATALSNSLGDYAFHDLPAGHYTIEVQVPGFRISRSGNLAVVNGGKVQADAKLDVGNLAERVMVRAAGGAANPVTAPAGGSAKPYRIGGMVQAANVIQQTKPVYPADLQAQGIEGAVTLRAVISKEGAVTAVQPMSTGVNPKFVNSAMDAVRQWRYKPTRLNGEAIEVTTTVEVDFQLSSQAGIIDDRLRK